MDTNLISQIVAQVTAANAAAQQLHSQISPWLPALTVAAGWAGREINRACASARGGAEWLMAHGGIIKIIGKIFYNGNA